MGSCSSIGKKEDCSGDPLFFVINLVINLKLKYLNYMKKFIILTSIILLIICIPLALQLIVKTSVSTRVTQELKTTLEQQSDMEISGVQIDLFKNSVEISNIKIPLIDQDDMQKGSILIASAAVQAPATEVVKFMSDKGSLSTGTVTLASTTFTPDSGQFPFSATIQEIVIKVDGDFDKQAVEQLGKGDLSPLHTKDTQVHIAIEDLQLTAHGVIGDTISLLNNSIETITGYQLASELAPILQLPQEMIFPLSFGLQAYLSSIDRATLVKPLDTIAKTLGLTETGSPSDGIITLETKSGDLTLFGEMETEAGTLYVSGNGVTADAPDTDTLLENFSIKLGDLDPALVPFLGAQEFVWSIPEQTTLQKILEGTAQLQLMQNWGTL